MHVFIRTTNMSGPCKSIRFRRSIVWPARARRTPASTSCAWLSPSPGASSWRNPGGWRRKTSGSACQTNGKPGWTQGEPMETHGHPWKPMYTHGKLIENQRKPMVNPWETDSKAMVNQWQTVSFRLWEVVNSWVFDHLIFDVPTDHRSAHEAIRTRWG